MQQNRIMTKIQVSHLQKNEFYDAQRAGRFFRKRTMKHVHTELKEITSKFGIEYIFFIADTFLAMSEKEFDEFCEMYSEFKLPFYMHTRPETITARRAKKLKEVNCNKVNIGVEHGNRKFRTEIVGRNYNNEVAIKSFELMYEAGISTTSNNILGSSPPCIGIPFNFSFIHFGSTS